MPSRISSSYRFTIQTPAEMPLLPSAGSGIAISPDGRTFVYVSASGLVKHALDSFEFEAMRGTEGARAPFFSPDSRWLGFSGDNKVRKIPLSGGVPTEIWNVQGAATWGDDDTIVVAAQEGKLYRLPSAGGKPEEIRVQGAAVTWGDPVFLPGSAAVLAVAFPAVGPSQIEAIRLATGERVALAEGTSPRFAAPDQLVFEQRGNLWTANLDVKHLALRGPAAPVIQGVRMAFGATALASVSTSTIAFAHAAASNEASLVWLDRTGRASPAFPTTAVYSTPRLSPDGRRAAVSIQSPTSLDVWVCDFERGTRLRLTTAGSNRRPVWSPDGSRIAFQSAGRIYIKRADGGGEAERLNDSPLPQYPDSWTADGRALLFNEGMGRRDILIQPLGGEAKPLVKTVFSERSAMIAPDGQWFSFVSDESGHDEVYVQPLAGGAKVVVSTNGGRQPAWSHSGRELFYREDDWLMSVDMSTPEHPGKPTRQFEFSRQSYGNDPNVVEYDIGPDGRILAVQQESRGLDDIRLIVNWHR
jgi:serine/threonine-protein kinase